MRKYEKNNDFCEIYNIGGGESIELINFIPKYRDCM